MEPTVVVVTAVGGGGVGEQIIKALRLAPTAYRIIGTDISPYSKGFMEVDHAEVVPPAKDPRFVDRLLGICAGYHARAVLCGSEAELKVLDQHRRRFEACKIFLPINPSFVLEACLDKVKTAEFLYAHGFQSPLFRRIAALADLEGFSHLPAVVKPSIGGGGSANLFLAQTRAELEFLAAHMLTLYPEFIVQEYVGTPDMEFTVGVLTTMDGVILQSIAVRRNILTGLSNRIKQSNRTSRGELGPVLAISNGISQGEIGPFPDVTRPCEQIAAALGSRGPLNLQCRMVEGRPIIFEINPRFSGTSSLRAMVGFNEPDLLIRHHVLNEQICPRFPYRSGTILRGLSESLLNQPGLQS